MRHLPAAVTEPRPKAEGWQDTLVVQLVLGNVKDPEVLALTQIRPSARFKVLLFSGQANTVTFHKDAEALGSIFTFFRSRGVRQTHSKLAVPEALAREIPLDPELWPL